MIFKLALRNLTRSPRRTFAALLTIALGSGSLCIFNGFNHGIMNQYKQNTIHARYGHGQIHEKNYRNQVYEKPWDHWISDWREMARDLKQIPHVNHVFPRVQFFSLLTNGKVTVSGKAQGVDGKEESQFFNTLNIEQGVNLSDQRDGILLGQGLARSLDLKVGDRVTLLTNTVYGSMNAADLTVVGIFHTGQKEFDDNLFRIPLDQALRLLDTQKVESIALGLDSDHAWSEIAQAILSRWPNLDAIPFEVLDRVYYQNSVDWLKSQFAMIRIIILTIVILGIFNTVSTSLLDRKQELGNLRANGDSSQDVLRLLLCEGLVLGLLGGALGIVGSLVIQKWILGHGILMPPAPGLTRQFHVFIEIEPEMIITAFTLGAIASFLATFFAAYQLSKAPIAASLRSV